jgi:DNA-binding PucR family transcriptional regulator
MRARVARVADYHPTTPFRRVSDVTFSEVHYYEPNVRDAYNRDRGRSLEPKDLEALLERLSGSPDLRPFRELVEPLRNHDRERNSDLVSTLKVFFASGANASETADRMLLHRNSTPYRLERVRELTGLDSRNYRARLAMQLGLLALEKEEELDEVEHP